MKQTIIWTGFVFFTLLIARNPADAQEGWMLGEPVPTPRGLATASVIEGKIYVIGGTDNAFCGSTFVVEVYDPASDSWDLTKAGLPAPLCGAASAVVDGRIYVIGGRSGFDTPVYLASVYAYDPETDQWSSVAPMPTPRGFLAACVLEGQIYAIGGATWGDVITPTVERYDPEENVWTGKVADLNTGRSGLSAKVAGDRIYVMGGTSSIGNLPLPVEAYNPATNQWEEAGSLPAGRCSHGAGVYGDKIYVYGGIGENLFWHEDLLQYDPSAGVFYNESVLPESEIKLGPATVVVGDELFAIGGLLEPFLIPALPGAAVSETVLRYNFSVTAVNVRTGTLVPAVLLQNYPNPFTGSTSITYELKRPRYVRLQVFNLLGREVARLADSYQAAGTHTVIWDAGALPPGVYVYQLQGKGFSLTKRCVIGHRP